MKGTLVFFAAISLVACEGAVGTTDDQSSTQNDLRPEPPMAGIHWSRDEAGSHQGGGDPHLLYHGGPVMTAGAYVEPIFWGTSWSNSSFAGDKISGIQSFYGGMGGSTYDATNSEYTDSSGAHVGSGVTLGPSHVDTTAAAKNGNRTSPILAEACAQASTLVENGYYPVYVDQPRGHAGFCAWHSTGTCPNGVQIQFAFFFNLDGDLGCDPGDGSGLHSQGLAALANVSGHEYSEALTDPRGAGWFDSSGAENADKCAWTFGRTLVSFGGTSWKIQGNWSNAAYSAGTGYPARVGCIDGN
jgi:hypothetical protein